MNGERPAWHRLLAPLPTAAVPARSPVAPPDVIAMPAAASIAGWEQLVVELSDAGRGLRVVLVVIDAAGRPISASDSVLFRTDGNPPQVRHESIGGRIETDGAFRGTHWTSEGPESAADEPPPLPSTPRAPSPAETAMLLALVDDIVRRSQR